MFPSLKNLTSGIAFQTHLLGSNGAMGSGVGTRGSGLLEGSSVNDAATVTMEEALECWGFSLEIGNLGLPSIIMTSFVSGDSGGSGDSGVLPRVRSPGAGARERSSLLWWPVWPSLGFRWRAAKAGMAAPGMSDISRSNFGLHSLAGMLLVTVSPWMVWWNGSGTLGADDEHVEDDDLWEVVLRAFRGKG